MRISVYLKSTGTLKYTFFKIKILRNSDFCSCVKFSTTRYTVVVAYTMVTTKPLYSETSLSGHLIDKAILLLWAGPESPDVSQGRIQGGGGGALGAEAPPFIFRLYLINMLSIIMKFCLSIII